MFLRILYLFEELFLFLYNFTENFFVKKNRYLIVSQIEQLNNVFQFDVLDTRSKTQNFMLCLFLFVWKIRDDMEQILNTIVGKLKLYGIANFSTEKALVLVVKLTQTLVLLVDVSLTLFESRHELKDVIFITLNILLISINDLDRLN